MCSHGFPSSSSDSVSSSVNSDIVMVLAVVPFVSSSKGTEGLVTEQG